ncbi:hypothetical protein C6361_06085 [Plantactinospora sp. BC1]|nr:hypothetical protein C6361_06085 [Plantactinospora sp. BC1]
MLRARQRPGAPGGGRRSRWARVRPVRSRLVLRFCRPAVLPSCGPAVPRSCRAAVLWWRHLLADLPPWRTVYRYFSRWEEAGVTEQLLASLRIRARVRQGRSPDPSAGIVDSRSVKGPTRWAGTVAATTPARRSMTAGDSSSPTLWVCGRLLPGSGRHRRARQRPARRRTRAGGQPG